MQKNVFGFIVYIVDYGTDLHLQRYKKSVLYYLIILHETAVDERGFYGMKKTQIKDIFRNIWTNIVSWLAVVIVVTITCGVYCGVFFYADELEDSAGEFFERTSFEDLTISSTLGMTEDDCVKLLDVPDVKGVEGTYRLSGVNIDMGEESHKAEIQAITQRISVPELIEGDMPDSETECAMTVDAMERFDVSLGDEVELELINGNSVTFSVTGVIRHPDSYYQGESVYVFVPASTFKNMLGIEQYPVVLIDVSSNGGLLSDEYYNDISSVRSGLSDNMKRISLSKDKDLIESNDTRFVITARMDRESFVVLRQIVDILRKLSTVFVVIFVVIGAIVVFSTIAVIIDGQKRLIGFMEASGFTGREIVLRYLFYGESAVFVGMICSVGVAFILQLVIRNVLDGMFCLEIVDFSFRLDSYIFLFILEVSLTGIISSVVTVLNLSKYSAIQLLHWNASENHSNNHSKNSSSKNVKGNALYSRLIYRNMRNDWARVTASVIIVAGCCFMIGIGFTLNSAFHSMTRKTREEVAFYDIECACDGAQDIDDLEETILSCGASCVRVYKKQTVYAFDDVEEYITVVAASRKVYQDYIQLIGVNGERVSVPDSDCVLVQNRISERLGVKAGDDIVLYDELLKPYSLKVSGTARNYLGRVIYLSDNTFLSVFGDDTEPDTLLVRLNNVDRDYLTNMIEERYPDVDISFTDSMPSMFSGLTDAFDALIYVLITLSVIMSFFVLLNLVNIFVNRRKNELIIMDINGFSYREIIGYLLRETIATTILGLISGVLFGTIISEPVVRIIEAPDTMCDRSLNWKAWTIGVVAEAVFALAINLYAFRRVKYLNKGDLK